MSGDVTVVGEGLNIAEAATLCRKVLDTGKAIPEATPAEDGTFTVTARAYSGGYRPYTRWPIRKIDWNLRFRVTKPYKKPIVTPFIYPKDSVDYSEYIGNKAYDTYERLEREAEERREEHEAAYERTLVHIKEKLGEKSDTTKAVPEESVRNTIDSILRRGYFINPDENEEEGGMYAR